MKDNYCKFCLHWKETGNEYSSIRKHFCRRFPPSVIITHEGLKSVFPETREYDSCGEYKMYQIPGAETDLRTVAA